MYEILKVNGPRGVLPSVFYKLDGCPLNNNKINDYMCHPPGPNLLKRGNLVVIMTPEEFELSKKALETKAKSSK